MTMVIAVLANVTVVMVTALLACRCLRRRPAAVRHMVLAASLGAAAAAPLLEVALPQWQLRVLSRQPSAASVIAPSAADRGAGLAAAAAVYAPAAPRVTWIPVVVVAWAAGFVLLAVHLLAGLVRLGLITRRSVPVQSHIWRDAAAAVAAQYGLRRQVRILESRASAPLMTWGVFTPRIIVPPGSAAWPRTRIDVVLAHEIAHIVRHDWVLQVAAQALRAVYWFNPLVWISCRRMREESEYACDDAVLRRGVEGAEYASHLLTIARDALATSRGWAPAPAIVNSSTLERRIAAMLNGSRNRAPITRTTAILTLVVTLVASASLAAVTLAERGSPSAILTSIARDVVLTAPVAAIARPAATATPPRSVRPSRPAPPVVAVAAPAPAAQAPATFTGRLLDQSGATLPGVQVTLRNTETETSYPAVSDVNGLFTFRNIPSGRYELTARLPGFRTLTDIVTLAGNDDVQRSLLMSVGSLVETVAVTCGGGAATLPRSVGAPVLAVDRRGATTPLFGLPQAVQLQPVRVGGQIAAPRQTSRTTPTCPGVPPGGGLVVIVEATIGPDGLMRDIVSLRPIVADQQQAPFVQAAVDAISQWQYTPTRLNNVAIPVILTVTVTYSAAR